MSEVAQKSDRSKPVRLDVQIPPEMDDHIQADMAEGGWTSAHNQKTMMSTILLKRLLCRRLAMDQPHPRR